MSLEVTKIPPTINRNYARANKEDAAHISAGLATAHMTEIKEKKGSSTSLTSEWPEVLSLLMELSESAVDDYLSLRDEMRRMKGILDQIKPSVGENEIVAGIPSILKVFTDRITLALEGGDGDLQFPMMKQYKDVSSFVAMTVAQELLAEIHKIHIPPESVGALVSTKEMEVNTLTSRGKNGFPPEKPFFPDIWRERGGAKAFVVATYGHLLDLNNPENNFLYQDQLSWIHPNKDRRKKLVPSWNDDPELIGNQIWGFDVVKALKNSGDIHSVISPSTARAKNPQKSASSMEFLREKANLISNI